MSYEKTASHHINIYMENRFLAADLCDFYMLSTPCYHVSLKLIACSKTGHSTKTDASKDTSTAKQAKRNKEAGE